MAKEGNPREKTRLSAGMVLVTVFFSAMAFSLLIFYMSVAPSMRHITVTVWVRLDLLLATIREFIILHDNARPHTAEVTRRKWKEMKWTLLDHPPYSPDLPPCDFHLFGPLKEILDDKRFQDDAGVEGSVRNWLMTHPRSFYDKDIKKLPIRWASAFPKQEIMQKSNLYFTTFI